MSMPSNNLAISRAMRFSRYWAMPDSETFSIPIIGDFVKRYLNESTVSVDPFARNRQWAEYTNDINPATTARHHHDAEQFLKIIQVAGVQADLLLFDPPYSPRQIQECYQQIGKACSTEDTQNAALHRRVRDAALPILTHDAIVLSFGWNSSGMGKERGFEIIELMLVCHGGAHNDTICLAERRTSKLPQGAFSL